MIKRSLKLSNLLILIGYFVTQSYQYNQLGNPNLLTAQVYPNQPNLQTFPFLPSNQVLPQRQTSLVFPHSPNSQVVPQQQIAQGYPVQSQGNLQQTQNQAYPKNFINAAYPQQVNHQRFPHNALNQELPAQTFPQRIPSNSIHQVSSNQQTNPAYPQNTGILTQQTVPVGHPESNVLPNQPIYQGIFPNVIGNRFPQAIVSQGYLHQPAAYPQKNLPQSQSQGFPQAQINQGFPQQQITHGFPSKPVSNIYPQFPNSQNYPQGTQTPSFPQGFPGSPNHQGQQNQVVSGYGTANEEYVGNGKFAAVHTEQDITWQKALSTCQVLYPRGASLFIVNGRKDSAWLGARINNEKDHNTGSSKFWVGLKSLSENGPLKWIDNTPFSYNDNEVVDVSGYDDYEKVFSWAVPDSGSRIKYEFLTASDKAEAFICQYTVTNG